jgi:predicted nucleotidyltransferase
MNLFIELHQQLIKAMLDNGVDFIVIGGYSVIFHGYQRTTGDIDIWLKPDNDNKKKLINVLKYFSIPDDYLDEISTQDFAKHLVFSLGEEPEKIDFITRINLVAFDDANKMKVIADMDGIPIPFLHLNHLILSKINTGRLKDAADIEKLQQIQQAKEKKQ